MKKIIITLTVIFCCQLSFSQNVGIGTTSPQSSALLDLQSTEKGFLMPRMNSTQRNLLPSPATGLVVFDTDKGAIYMFDGVQWLPLGVNTNSLVTQPRGLSNPANHTGFGWKTCISGNYAAISASKWTGMGSGPWIDTVFMYEKLGGSWTFRSKLVQSDPVGGDGFGQAIAIVGDYLLVGTPNRNNNTGAVYSFIRSGQNWTQSAILTASSPQVNSRFGARISMGSAYALIGAPAYKVNGLERGTVYNFSRNISTWSQVQQLWGLNIESDFGDAIDISGNYALVGAPRTGYNGVVNSGVAYFYKRVGALWSPADTIYNPFAEAEDQFGFSVAINESTNRAFISRPKRETVNSNTGEVINYFIGNQPTQFIKQGVLTNPASHKKTFNEFGYSIDLYNEYLVVGVPYADNGDAANGRVYIYKFDDSFPAVGDKWQPWKVIIDESLIPSYLAHDTYGYSVCINGTNIIIGNPGANNFKGKVLFLDIY